MNIRIDDVRFRRLVEHLHGLGPRALGEFLVDIASGGRTGASSVDFQLYRYEHVRADNLAALGADSWPPLPLHLVADAER